MTPAKPPTTATTPPQAPAHAATLAPPIPLAGLLKGLSFANVLEQAVGPKPPSNLPSGSPPLGPTGHPALMVHPDAEKRGRHDGGGHDLDPMTRQTAQLAPPTTPSATTGEVAAGAVQTNARVSLEDLVPELVKRIAWSGDSRRGTVRMELGSGELAGSTVMVSADNGRVTVQVHTPPGTDADAWRARIANRLEARGLSVDSVEVS
jgi:hypothetical protein